MAWLGVQGNKEGAWAAQGSAVPRDPWSWSIWLKKESILAKRPALPNTNSIVLYVITFGCRRAPAERHSPPPPPPGGGGRTAVLCKLCHIAKSLETSIPTFARLLEQFFCDSLIAK